MVFDLRGWTCHWDHMVLFGGGYGYGVCVCVCVLENDSKMVRVESDGVGGSDVQKQIIIFIFCLR